MNLAEEDWLMNEKFDFDLNVSRSSFDGLLNVDDEEVFVNTRNSPKENEPDIKIFDGLDSDGKEYDIATSRIVNSPVPGLLRNASKSNTKSPVAIVHPMIRDNSSKQDGPENKENVPNDTIKDICHLNLTLGSSNLSAGSSVGATLTSKAPSKNKRLKRLSLPPKTSSSNPTGLVEPFCTKGMGKNKDVKIDAPPSVSKIKASSSAKKLTKVYSCNSDVGDQSSLAKKQNSIGPNNSIQSRLKKPLLIPKPSSMSKSKSGGGIPTIPSSVSRTKQENGSTGLRPLKTTSQSLSGISQIQEKNKVSNLKLSSRKCISVATPESHKKISKTSAIKKSSVTKKSLSSVDTPLTEKRMLKPPRSIPKQSSLITPNTKPSRKSIVSRKLISASEDESSHDDKASINELMVKTSELSMKNDFPEDMTKELSIGCTTNEDGYEVITLSPTIVNNQEEKDFPLNSVDETSKEENTPEILVTQEKEILELSPTESCVFENSVLEKGMENVLLNSKDMEITIVNVENKNETEVDLLGLNSVEIDAVSVPPLLLDISSIESEISPLKVNSMDPFKTGHTPPPLIQLDMILEPEKPPELNLIEFF